MLKRLSFASIVLLMSACAHIPSTLEGDNFHQQLTPQLVAQQPELNQGKSVRWGGVIVEVVNNEQETWIEVLALPLSSSARPLSDRTESMGRFIAKTTEFLDPEVYQKGLRLTVTGLLSEAIEGKVGERDYIYATVQVGNHYLWPRRTMHRHYVTPGYWFYGFHPYWRFGYPYFGYGVWSYYNHYYPYFPVYGYLSRSNHRPHHRYRSGDFTYAQQLDWTQRQRAWSLRNIQHQRILGASRYDYRRSDDRNIDLNRRNNQTSSNRVRQNRSTGVQRPAVKKRKQKNESLRTRPIQKQK